MRLALIATVLGVAVSGPASGPTYAATPTASFGVTATVQAGCAVSASAMTSPRQAISGEDAAAAVTVNCSHWVPYSVSVSGGLATDARVAGSSMTGPGVGRTLAAQGGISAGQSSAAGIYADTITVTVIY